MDHRPIRRFDTPCCVRDATYYIICLFRTTQDTIFFVLIIYTFAGFAVLGAEIEVAMEVENEHLAEVPHLCMLRVRSKSGEVFGLDAVAFDGEGIHQHGTETPFVGIVTEPDMVVELAVL